MQKALLGWKPVTVTLLTAAVLAAGTLSGLLAAGGSDSSQKAYQQGVTAYRAGQFSQALEAFTQASTEPRYETNARYYQAVIYDKQGNKDAALANYRYVIGHGAEARVSQYAQSRLLALAPKTTQKANQEEDDLQANLAVISRVPLKNYKNALMVDATLINTKTGQRVTGTFIVDTGATYTSISQEMADALGFSDSGDVHITTANGRIRVPKVSVDRINVNGLVAEGIEATVIDVRKGSSFSGLLGLNFLKRFKMTIDPEAMELTFQPAY